MLDNVTERPHNYDVSHSSGNRYRFGASVFFVLLHAAAVTAVWRVPIRGAWAWLLATYAVINKNFWLLITATVIAGYYSANGQLYRFAAAELAKPEYRERAVSMVLAGGIVGGVLGPNLAKWAQHAGSVPFAKLSTNCSPANCDSRFAVRSSATTSPCRPPFSVTPSATTFPSTTTAAPTVGLG